MKQPRKRFGKLPYPTGILSVGLLLLLSALMMMPKESNERALQIVSYSPNDNADMFSYTSKSEYTPISVVIARKKFNTYSLSNNDFENSTKLKQAADILYKQRLKHDTINGVHFYINDDIKYGSIIRAAEIVKFTRVDSTHINVFYKNNIWAFTHIPPKRKPEKIVREYNGVECGTSNYYCGSTWMDYAETRRKKKEEFIQATINYYWPLSLLWVLLLFTSLYNVLKAYKPRPHSYPQMRR